MTKETLWPDFDFENETRTVKTILRDEGSGIQEKSNGLIRFEVSTTSFHGEIEHTCHLTVSKIGYQYPFLKVSHGISEYPAKIIADIYKHGKQVNGESELLDSLREIFGAPETVQLIRNLYRAAS